MLLRKTGFSQDCQAASVFSVAFRYSVLLTIKLLKLTHLTKRNPINDDIIHAHHDDRRNREFPIFGIDPINCL